MHMCELITCVNVTCMYVLIPTSLAVLDPGLVSLSLVYALSLAEAFRRSVRNSTDVEGMVSSVQCWYTNMLDDSITEQFVLSAQSTYCMYIEPL